jgi:hypothetical protein
MMKVYFAYLFLTLSILLGFQAKALACAGCMDITHPDIVIKNVSKKTISQFKRLEKQGLRLSQLSCQKQGDYYAGDAEYLCLFEGSGIFDWEVEINIELREDEARQMLIALDKLEVEPSLDEDDDLSLGEKLKVGEKLVNATTFKISIENIHMGHLSLEGKNLKLELNVLNWFSSPRMQLD